MTADPLLQADSPRWPARQRPAPASTESVKRLAKRALARDAADLGPWLGLRDALRPTSRVDCPLVVPVLISSRIIITAS